LRKAVSMSLEHLPHRGAEAPLRQRRAHTPAEAQQILRVSKATLFRMLREGRLASIKIGHLRRITDDALDAVLNGGA
jgi:excisionase family DNA binding protein